MNKRKKYNIILAIAAMNMGLSTGVLALDSTHDDASYKFAG
jgi:hypothetical protein